MSIKIICPDCGEQRNYYMLETVSRYLVFDVDDEPIDFAGDDICVYSGKVKRCLNCGRKIKIVEV